MADKKLQISIVIPVYNEERCLGACLDAIADQILKPYEVIVVDNNSSDRTVQIAQQYSFVKVIRASSQGVVYARNVGFESATGDIIARIDADTQMPLGWTEYVQKIFNETKIDALSGAVCYYDMPFHRLTSNIDLFFRRRLARFLRNNLFLYGANMAMRRSAWPAVRNKVCLRAGLHEDLDLAVHLRQTGHTIAFDENLIAAVSLRRIDTNFAGFFHYINVSPYTYAQHHIKKRWHMYTIIVLLVINYGLLKLLFRSYNSRTGKISLPRVFTIATRARIDPSAHQALD